MVECLFRIERFEEAERVLRESLPLAIPSGNQSYRLPDVALQYALLGRSQEAQGKSGEALASYRRSLEIDPNNRESRAGVARLGGTFSID
jgi:tetratricopeptide (TPR) repeat protein